ncbi:hypothetical protein Tco_1115262 [Tanacetum coccineum]
MSQPANDNFSLHDDEELSLHDDASLDGSVPATNKGDAPAKPPQIITTNTLSNIKLPVLQKDDYDTWAMEMEHYLEYIDNEVWKVIQNGNSKKRVTKGKDGVYRVLPPATQEEQFADEKERKARTLLLMAVPKDHLRRFHGMDDAKEIWAAIKTRWSSTTATPGLADEVIYSFLATNADDLDLIHEDLYQIERSGNGRKGYKWQIAITAIKNNKKRSSTRRQGRRPRLIDCGMSSTVKIGLGYGIQSNAEVLGYEEEISRGIFVLRETDAGYYDIPLKQAISTVGHRMIHLYGNGKYGPQPQSPSPYVSDAVPRLLTIHPMTLMGKASSIL